MSAPFPRGIEVLLKKASVDAEFRTILLDDPSQAAASIELALEPVESAMLQNIPTEQLAAIIDRTEVPQPQRRAFLGTAAAAMVAVLAGSNSALAGGPPLKGWVGGGGRSAGIAPGMPPGGGTFGNRPDEPNNDEVPRNIPDEVRRLVAQAMKMDYINVKPGTQITLRAEVMIVFRKEIYPPLRRSDAAQNVTVVAERQTADRLYCGIAGWV